MSRERELSLVTALDGNGLTTEDPFPQIEEALLPHGPAPLPKVEVRAAEEGLELFLLGSLEAAVARLVKERDWGAGGQWAGQLKVCICLKGTYSGRKRHGVHRDEHTSMQGYG